MKKTFKALLVVDIFSSKMVGNPWTIGCFALAVEETVSSKIPGPHTLAVEETFSSKMPGNLSPIRGG